MGDALSEFLKLTSSVDQEWMDAVEWLWQQSNSDQETLMAFVAMVSPKLRDADGLIAVMTEKKTWAELVCRLCYVALGESLRRLTDRMIEHPDDPSED